MGFNLEMFFDDLYILMDKDLNSEELLLEIEDCIKEARKYAYECGYIRSKD